jgi:hypothetical protein
MKTAFFLIWLAIPLVWLGWHYGPGQEYLKLDASDRAVKEALTATTLEDRLKSWDVATSALPPSEINQIRRLRLARAQMQASNRQMADAGRDLDALYNEMKDDPASEPEVLHRVEEDLAGIKYAMTWIMRLEGRSQEDWEPEIESARQHFRLLAEKSPKDDARWQRNLELSIRLGRVDLLELQGQPLPEKMQGTGSGRPAKGPGKKGPPKGEEDSRGAGGAQAIDATGS